MKRLSILIYSLSSGGAERFTSILVKHFVKYYKVHLVLMNDTLFYEIPPEVKIHYLEKSEPSESGLKKLIKIPFLGSRYKKFLEREKIDMSISLLNRPNYINTLAKVFGFKKKVIISERITPSKEYGTKSFKDIISRWLIRKLYRYADFIVPNSKGIAFDLKTKFGINENKIKVIYNPINVGYITKLKHEKVNLRKERFTFVTIGRLHPQKNHKLLLGAIKHLDASLWIIGDGELKKDLELMIKDLGLKDRIKLLGRQKNPLKFLNIADCFVFSSNYEGFPNALLEALACGLPVISTDCRSGPREILAPDTDFRNEAKDIEFAKYGILVSVGDVDKMAEAMRIIYENKELREKYSRLAFERAKDFDVEKIIKKWEEVLKF